ncbi:hypothetical protein EDB80DRAFT_699117 [Ilyonectria destructans]|nr:hypothetical protein EDB80DRAFT_699117 [Ilyonectria destructans]
MDACWLMLLFSDKAQTVTWTTHASFSPPPRVSSFPRRWLMKRTSVVSFVSPAEHQSYDPSERQSLGWSSRSQMVGCAVCCGYK